MKDTEALEVAIKVVGILTLLEGLSALIAIPMAYEMANNQGLSVATSVTYASLHAAIYIAFGAFMVFRTSAIVSRVSSSNPSGEEIAVISFNQAIQLLGLFLGVWGLGEFIDNFEYIFFADRGTTVVRGSLLYAPMLYILAGAVMLFRPSLVSRLLPRACEAHNKRVYPTHKS